MATTKLVRSRCAGLESAARRKVALAWAGDGDEPNPDAALKAFLDLDTSARLDIITNWVEKTTAYRGSGETAKLGRKLGLLLEVAAFNGDGVQTVKDAIANDPDGEKMRTLLRKRAARLRRA